jgi:hypothetical protein
MLRAIEKASSSDAGAETGLKPQRDPGSLFGGILDGVLIRPY